MADNVEKRTEMATAFLRKEDSYLGEKIACYNSLTIPNTQLNDVVDKMVKTVAERLGYQPEEMIDYKLTITVEASERQSN